jgi:opacity protein-like surface antigen
MTIRISSSIFLLALSSLAFASPPSVTPTTPKFYIGAFGGWGLSHDLNANQFGTIFLEELDGGPLAVNALGELDNKNSLFFGAQLGYQAQERLLNSSSHWTLAPAVELEGYAMNQRSFKGTLNNITDRDTEHDFRVSYPMRKTVFLANAVLNFNNDQSSIHPYVGFGIGNAIVRISDASSTATEIIPRLEDGTNHYNANTSDTNSTFAAQLKLGLNYDISKCISLFAEYRFLYLASSHFVLGSTVSPGHPASSSWHVKLDAQRHHLGDVGIRFNW